MRTREKKRVSRILLNMAVDIQKPLPFIRRWQRLVARQRRNGTLKDFALLALNSEDGAYILLADHGLDLEKNRSELRTDELIKLFSEAADMTQILEFLRACLYHDPVGDSWWNHLTWLWAANPPVVKTEEVASIEDIRTIFACMARGDGHWVDFEKEETTLKKGLLRQLERGQKGEAPDLVINDVGLVKLLKSYGEFINPLISPELASLEIVKRYRRLTQEADGAACQ